MVMVGRLVNQAAGCQTCGVIVSDVDVVEDERGGIYCGDECAGLSPGRTEDAE